MSKITKRMIFFFFLAISGCTFSAREWDSIAVYKVPPLGRTYIFLGHVSSYYESTNWVQFSSFQPPLHMADDMLRRAAFSRFGKEAEALINVRYVPKRIERDLFPSCYDKDLGRTVTLLPDQDVDCAFKKWQITVWGDAIKWVKESEPKNKPKKSKKKKK